MDQILLYSNILLWVVQIVVFFALFLIFRQFGQVFLGTADGISRDGIPIGENVVEFKGLNYHTGEIFIHRSLGNKPTLLVFISPNCGACKDLISDWNKSYEKNKNRVNFVLMGVGQKEEFDTLVKGRNPQGKLILDVEDKFLKDFRVRGTPFALVLNEHGVVTGKGLCNDATHIEGLITTLGSDTMSIKEVKGVS